MSETDLDKGFEQGSLAACNAIVAYLRRKGHGGAANDVVAAWENESMFSMPPTIEPASAPAMGRQEARQSGYTGDQCPRCQSMRMKHTGHCNTCEECGETTGCS